MRASLVVLAALVAVTYAVGQYYVPRSYYIIDSDGHETAPVPLRRLRRSLGPQAYVSGSRAGGKRHANVNGGDEVHARSLVGTSSGRLYSQDGQPPIMLLGDRKSY